MMLSFAVRRARTFSGCFSYAARAAATLHLLDSPAVFLLRVTKTVAKLCIAPESRLNANKTLGFYSLQPGSRDSIVNPGSSTLTGSPYTLNPKLKSSEPPFSATAPHLLGPGHHRGDRKAELPTQGLRELLLGRERLTQRTSKIGS